MELASERGAVRLTSAARLTILVAVFAVIAFDLSAIVVNIFQLDELSRAAALSAAQAWRDSPSATVVQSAVQREIAADDGVQVAGIVVDATTVRVTLRRPPPVIALDRLPPVRDRLNVAITQRAMLDPQQL